MASELDTSANTQDGSSATGLNLDVQNVAEAKVVEPPAPARITPKPFVPRMPPGLGMWSSSARSSKAPSGLGESLTIGLPPTEESQERIRKLNPGRYAFENPETARTFSNPKNVVDSFDDIENMGTFERLFKDTATSKDRGLKVLELSELGANLWQGEGYDPVSMAEIERVKREMKEIPDFGWENRDAGWVFNIPGQVAEMAPLSLHTFLSAQEAGLASGVATAGLGALAGLPAGGVGAGPGALSGFAYGYGTGTALSAVYAAGKAEAGLALIELKDLTSPDGILIPQDTAKALSLAVGTVNGLLETFALGKIVGTFPGGDKLLGQFSRGGVKQALQNPTVFGLMMRLSGAFAGSAAREGVTEGMQEGVLVTAIGAFMKASGEGFENFTHEVADPETGESVTLNGSEAFWARVFESAIAGAQGGGGMGLTGQALTETSGALGLNADRVRGAVKNLNNLSGVQKAGATLSRVMKMNKTASESTLRETNPEAYADHVKRSYPQGEIYISSEAVQRFMGNVEDPRSIQEIIASIEGLQAQIEDSAETGNDIVLSIEDYMLNVAHTPLASAISRHVRFTPEDMTAVQADAFKGSISGALEESGEAMLAELTESERAELDAKVDADQESLTESQAREDASAMIWGQLRGTYENSEASAFTEIALAQMEARADRKGLSLSQLIAQEGMPQIIGPGQELPEGATRTFDQSEYPLESRDRWYADADYKARGASLVEMTPDEFLSRTKLLEIDELTRENIDELKEKMERGEPLDPLTIYKDDLTDVRASDGRHRAIAAKELGIEIVPVLDFTSRQFDQPGVRQDPAEASLENTGFIQWSEGTEVVLYPEDHAFLPGQAVTVHTYHGTTYDIDDIRSDAANNENHIGAGFYSTSEEYDARTNYAGEGPDLTARIHSLAESIEWEIPDDPERFDLDPDQDFSEVDLGETAREWAREQLTGDNPEGETLGIWVRLDNPFVRGRFHLAKDNREIGELESEIDLESDFEYDEDGDITSESISEHAQAMLDVLMEAESEFTEVDAEKAFSEIMEHFDYGQSRAVGNEFIQVASEAVQYAENYNEDTGQQEMVSSEIVRRMLERMGFDGVIYQQAKRHFSNMDMSESTKHFVLFDAAGRNVKSTEAHKFDAENANIYWQPAFHGGPHRFDKFTTDAIGTGEGAQAFGWGLYFSSSRGIAEFYRENLSSKQIRVGEDLVDGAGARLRPDGSLAPANQADEIVFARLRSKMNPFGGGSGVNDAAKAISEVRKDLIKSLEVNAEDFEVSLSIRDQQIALDRMEEQGLEIIVSGQLFEVDIPEDNELMDWDAPLSEQIPKVQEIMLDFRRTMHSDNWMEQVDGQTLNRTISAAFADPKSRIHKATGESFYRTMAEYYGGDAEVSKALSAAGIKGHKYQANQISGGPGTATNYVIYDENAIEIAKTFFQPERGSIDLSDPELRNVVIRLGEAADRSTFLHESGHLWLAQLDKDARVDGGEFAADLETIKAHMREAVGTDDVFSSEFQEQWASWTENYFMRGISPTKALRAVFKKFGAWLTKLYGAMENIPGFQGPLSPEIVEIMDRMFATQEQLKDEQVEREVSDLLVEEKDASKRAGVPAMALSEARGKAREIIENTQWRHLKPHKYRLAAAREGRLALEAAIQDDFAKSSMHKRRQVLNALLESDARRAKENGLKAANFANRLQTKRRLSRIGLAGQEYLQVILGLLNRFDLNVSRTIKEIENRKSLSEFIIERESEYDPIYISDKIRDEAFTKSWKELTIKELSELTDALKNIETIAVRQFEFNAAGQKEMQAEVRASLVDAIKKNVTGRDLRRGNARLLDKMRSIFVGAEASLAKMEAISLLFDGLDPNGAWSQKVYQPVSDSVERRNDLSAEKTEELNALMESYLKPRIEEYSKVFETPFKSRRTGKNVEMNMLEVVSLFLNIGNNGNVQRIEDGNGWKLQDVEAFVFSKMSREDYAFAKEASEIIGSLWSEIAADEARTAGIVPEKVIGRTIKTPFGDFQGAYFPIIYDPFHSMRAEDLNKKSINDGIVNPFASISGRPGAANERMRKVKDRAILFDLSVIPNHIDEIVSKVSTRDTLMQVHKLLKHEDIRRALQETTLGEEYFSLFEPWLMDIANDRVTESANIAGLNSFMKRIRLGETAGALAFRLSTLMGQPLGHSNAYGVARKMIPNYAKYHATVMSNPAFVAREAESVFEESATIRQRIKYIGREARDLSRSVDVGSMSLASKDSSTLAKKAIKGALTTEQKSKEVADFGMRLIGKLQVYAVDLPVYLAVQEAAIQELDMSPKDAQRLAEKVVRISQGGGDTKDLAAIQRGTELSKIFTVFYSYMSAVYNQAVTLGLRTVKDRGKAAILADLTFALIIPGITYDLMKAAMGGRGGPEDDADVVGYLKWLAQILVSEAMGTVPVVTLFSGAVTGQNSFGFEPSIARVVKNTGTFLGSVREGDIEDAAWESLDVLRSFMYGFPPSYPVDKIEEFLRE